MSNPRYFTRMELPTSLKIVCTPPPKISSCRQDDTVCRRCSLIVLKHRTHPMSGSPGGVRGLSTHIAEVTPTPASRSCQAGLVSDVAWTRRLTLYDCTPRSSPQSCGTVDTVSNPPASQGTGTGRPTERLVPSSSSPSALLLRWGTDRSETSLGRTCKSWPSTLRIYRGAVSAAWRV